MVMGTIYDENDANAQESSANPDGSRDGMVVVETVWYFTEKNYEPPIMIVPVTKEMIKMNTPENAAVANISAMYALDFNWWLSGHDKASKNDLLDQEKKAATGDIAGKRTREGWIEGWKKVLLPNDIFLVARADTPDFIIIAYEIKPKSSHKPKDITKPKGQDFWQGTFTFIRDDDKWLQTRQFAGHPVPRLWRTKERKMTLIGRYNTGTTKVTKGVSNKGE